MRTLKHLWTIVAVWAVLFGTSSCRQTEQSVSGKIEIAPLLERIPIHPQAALYLIVRPAGQTQGPPLAVQRFTPPFRFPVEFKITQKDAMIPETPFDGPFELTARLSQSGSASPAMRGDFEGEAATSPVPVGSTDVLIRLSKVKE